VEEPELIFRRIAELDDSVVGNVRFNNRALSQIRKSVKKIRQKVSDNNYKEIAVAMSALSRKNSFVDALSELSKTTEFVFHVHKVYSVKLNPNGSDKDESLLLETIRSALRKSMKHVPN
jgi:flavorubredoxin